jgi:ABC-type phosphate transport system substrate-binding protein
MKKITLLTLFMAAALVFAVRVEAQVIVIANNNVKTSEISKSDLHDVFTGGATSLKDGSRVAPILLKAGTVHEEFLSAFIGKGDAAFRASWRSLVFSGQASMPRSLDSETAVVEYVAHTPGAVGYVGKSTPHEGVKILAVR